MGRTSKSSHAPSLVHQELISLREIAQRWYCSRSTVKRILARAEIHPFFFGDSRNSTVRYSVAEIEAYMRRCKLDLCGRGSLNAASRRPLPHPIADLKAGAGKNP